MRVVVIAASQFGNTAKIAAAIGRGAEAAGAEIEVLEAADIDPAAILEHRVDLLVIGGPTVNRKMTAQLERCLAALQPHVRNLAVVVFDTRYRGAELIMGSAAKRAAKDLAAAGARLVAPPESFIVVRAEAPAGQRTAPGLSALADGEEARAEAWGRQLAGAMTAS